MRNTKLAALLLLICSAATPVQSEERRHQEAHEHGAGQLNVAVEQNSLMIDLSLPAMNVVGFEHPAHDQEERDQVARAVDLLRDGMGLFAPTPAAKCVLTRVEVESALLGHEEHPDEAAGHEEEDGHADFDVAYAFNCENPAQLTALTLGLFERFPGTHHLRTQVIAPGVQTGVELTDENRVLELK